MAEFYVFLNMFWGQSVAVLGKIQRHCSLRNVFAFSGKEGLAHGNVFGVCEHVHFVNYVAHRVTSARYIFPRVLLFPLQQCTLRFHGVRVYWRVCACAHLSVLNGVQCIHNYFHLHF